MLDYDKGDCFVFGIGFKLKTAIYNEIDPFLAKWLENLIFKGCIAQGTVLCASIKDVSPETFKGYNQVHLFAGIGGWSYAFRLVGWPDDRSIWSVSCPCPPWSRARIYNLDLDKTRDKRDLWPSAFQCIKLNLPNEIYGEQVAGQKAQEWILRTRKDLESIGYTFRGKTTKSSYVGAPSQRERFFFFAYLNGTRRERLVKGIYSSKIRSWRWRGEKDLRAIINTPFKPGDCWPQPLICRSNDGIPNRVATLRAYGNAIDPWQAAQFIFETQEGLNCGFFLRSK